MKITKEFSNDIKFSFKGNYYSVVMENEKDIEDISNLFYGDTQFETIERYRKYLRGNPEFSKDEVLDKSTYITKTPIHIYEEDFVDGNSRYKMFEEYLKNK